MIEKYGLFPRISGWGTWQKWIFGVVLAAGLLLLGVCVFFYDIPERDVAFRYAPMADAFASGNYFYAFHPRVPLLVPLLGGIVAKTGCCDGFLALKIVTAAAFLIALFPLRVLMLRVFDDEKIASVACGIYLLSPALMRFAHGGERDGIKSMIMIFIACFLVKIYQERNEFFSYIGCGIFCGLAMLVRVELLLMAGGALLLMLYMETRRSRFPKYSCAALLCAIVLSSPGVLVNYFMFHIAMPGTYTAKVVQEILHRPNTLGEYYLFLISGALLLLVVGTVLGRLPKKWVRAIIIAGIAALIAGCGILCASGKFNYSFGVWKFVERFCKGFCGFYAILLIPGIFLRIFDRKWNRADGVLFAFYLFHGLGIVLLMFVDMLLYISPRYLESAQPLMFGWCAYGIVRLWRTVHIPVIRAIGAAALAGVGIFCIHHALCELIVYRGDMQKKTMRRAVLDFSREIEKERGGNPPVCEKKPGEDNWEKVDLPYGENISYLDWRDGKWKGCGTQITVLSYLGKVRQVGGRNADYICLRRQENETVPYPKEFTRRKSGGKRGFRLIRKVFGGGDVYELWKQKE